ncbi:ABC-2 type transporter [Peptoclostridium litorale DSM 5388]|uniref:Transport permease protein n=1 Tax=Peptoclostridium litorale DSM 5388 TaxID=1121324 RepID=A0A069RQP3_PEPLI|nr:ABC transporter permease [Peptoclostridium litorale]KDR96497.1 ABC-2 type transporter [Peptoclostridium litorale DSM 5388]SIN69901.1 ABC-2 type transporter [Peptoclostridium litorale DSM 5388]
MEIKTILWREWTFFKHRFWKITRAQLITPLLYLITFGFGLGGRLSVEGQPYMFYLIPGLLAMTTMRNSYSAISMRVSVTRLHEKSFETFIYSPTRISRLAIGHILAGALRGVYSGIFVIIMGMISGVDFPISGWLILVIFLNSIIFAELGFFAAMVIDTHYDMNNFTNIVITPMSFLCGTFFSLSEMPWFFRWIIELLPLTHTTRLLRRIILGYGIDTFSLIATLFFAAALMVLSIRICYEEIKY